eukprot:TRINITY_DN8695_c0_g1_i13.p2 TRINITY_DN8695_c0_g1~~TRINITY_DN8695_c0_g1_i13.p2  ORF type:complete len:101 (+),score=6.30 TRINITY_DN8695_c0_g1_i13:247-549(+)
MDHPRELMGPPFAPFVPASFVPPSANAYFSNALLNSQYPSTASHFFPKKPALQPKETSTLIISNIPMHRLQELQQMLAQCGPIKVLNTERLSERLCSLIP